MRSYIAKIHKRDPRTRKCIGLFELTVEAESVFLAIDKVNGMLIDQKSEGYPGDIQWFFFSIYKSQGQR